MKPSTLKKCRECGKEFTAFNSTARACGWQCALAEAKRKNGIKRKKAFNKETKRRKDALKTKSDWKKEAQDAVNKYVRLRDWGKVCISCQMPPKKKNAGHYKSVGAYPELRFNLFNIHLQCEHCNTHKSGNQINYRIHLINRIGLDKVEWLEGPHEANKYDIEYIKRFKRIFNKRCRILERRLK